jgi:hypothetical protein
MHAFSTGIHFRSLLLCTGALFAVALAWSCGGISSPTGPDTPAPTQDPATATSLTFSGDVQPIVNNDCVSCHDHDLNP